MAKLCTQTELLSWHVGGLNSGLLPLIFVQITTFFIGEMLYSMLLFTSRNGSKAKCCVLGSWDNHGKAHMPLNLVFCHLVVISLNLCHFCLK